MRLHGNTMVCIKLILGPCIVIVTDLKLIVMPILSFSLVNGNYLMYPLWGTGANLTLGESYQYFLKMRKKGIRAHSWI